MEDYLASYIAGFNSFQTAWVYLSIFLFGPLSITFSFWCAGKLLKIPNNSFWKSFLVFLFIFTEWLILYLILKIVFSNLSIPTVVFYFFPLLGFSAIEKIFKTNTKTTIKATLLSTAIYFFIFAIFSWIDVYFILGVPEAI